MVIIELQKEISSITWDNIAGRSAGLVAEIRDPRWNRTHTLSPRPHGAGASHYSNNYRMFPIRLFICTTDVGNLLILNFFFFQGWIYYIMRRKDYYHCNLNLNSDKQGENVYYLFQISPNYCVSDTMGTIRFLENNTQALLLRKHRRGPNLWFKIHGYSYAIMSQTIIVH